MYRAAYERELDVISGYSTDGRLKAFDLIILQDDKGIFPPYYAAPIVRKEALRQFPELQNILNQLAGLINDSVMTELNYRVDYLKQSPAAVAKAFLEQKKLWKPARNGRQGPVRIGSKIFGEQYILASMYQMLLQGHSDYQVETKTGLGGTKICFDALTNNQIDLYPEYTGTGLLVILQASPEQIARLGTSSEKVYGFVKAEFDRRYQISWLKPIGFNNAYALMMRRQQARAKGITTISDLNNYLQYAKD
jgi:osmoprotectant transport system permease protein